MKNYFINMNKKILIYLLLIISIFISIFLKTFPYFYYKYEFLIGFDSGRYTYELINKTSSSLENLNIWVEPGFNTNSVMINTYYPNDPSIYFKYILPIFISVSLITIIFLYTKKITKSNIAGIASALYLSTSLIFLNATFDSFNRQIFGTIILLILLYFIDRTIEIRNMSTREIILFALLGAGIIITHRAITLLFLIVLGLVFLNFLVKKNFVAIKKLIIIFFISLFLSSIYWVPITSQNITVLKEAFHSTANSKRSGERIIKETKREDNQIVGYITLIPTSVLVIVGLLYLFRNKNKEIITHFSLFLIAYVYLKITFSNRFLFNLDLVFAIIIGVGFYYLKSFYNKSLLVLLFTLMLLLNWTTSFNNSLNRKPYADFKTTSFKWAESSLPEDALIFAPDALSTLFAQKNIKTSLNIYEVRIGSGDKDGAEITEDFLIFGHSDLSIVKKHFNNHKKIYVAFGQWHLTHPLPRAREMISLESWDNSPYFEKVYTGDALIYRIYKLKNT